MITDELIIECAKSNGFIIPSEPFNYFGKIIHITESDIKVNRARTLQFIGNKDLGEWWVSYYGSFTQFRVTDNDMTVFLRDRKIGDILK